MCSVLVSLPRVDLVSASGAALSVFPGQGAAVFKPSVLQVSVGAVS